MKRIGEGEEGSFDHLEPKTASEKRSHLDHGKVKTALQRYYNVLPNNSCSLYHMEFDFIRSCILLEQPFISKGNT